MHNKAHESYTDILIGKNELVKKGIYYLK